jgi:hypothetical protein
MFGVFLVLERTFDFGCWETGNEHIFFKGLDSYQIKTEDEKRKRNQRKLKKPHLCAYSGVCDFINLSPPHTCSKNSVFSVYFVVKTQLENPIFKKKAFCWTSYRQLLPLEMNEHMTLKFHFFQKRTYAHKLLKKNPT